MDVKPLLNRPPIYPGESLSSYLHRIAKANLLEVRHIDTLVKRLISGQDDYAHPSKGKTYSILSILTGLEPYKLYWASIHSLAPVLVDEAQLNENIVLDSGFSFSKMPDKFDSFHLRKKGNSQYCPDCLKEGFYERKVWRVRAVVACIEHRQLLIDRCPICAKRLRDTAILQASCGHCGFDLTKAPTFDLSEDSYGLETQAALYFWLNAGSHTPLCVPNFSSNHLYQLVTTLMRGVRNIKHTMMGLHPVPELSRSIKWGGGKEWTSPAHAYVAWVTAFGALMDWPNSLYNTIENIFRADGGEYRNDFFFRMGIYVKALLEHWTESKNLEINRALDSYLCLKSSWYFTQNRKTLRGKDIEITKKHPMFQDFQWLLDKHAAQYLNINMAMLNVLIDWEILRINPNFKYLEHNFVSCMSVLFVHDCWSEAVANKHAALILGLNYETIFKLSFAGRLEYCKGFDFVGRSVAGVTKASIDVLLDQFVALSMDAKVTVKACISLSDAVEMLSFWEYKEFHLLLLALDGRLPCRYTQDTLLGDIEFLQSAIFELAQSNAKGEHISMVQFARKIGGSSTFVEGLITRGYLPANFINYQNISFIPKKEAEAFDKKYISLRNAQRITKFVKGKFMTLISAHALVPVSGPEIDGLSQYLFLRKDIEPLVPENRMSLRELASFLNVSTSEVYKWIKQGSIRPFCGKSFRTYIFLKDQVAQQLEVEESDLFDLSDSGLKRVASRNC